MCTISRGLIVKHLVTALALTIYRRVPALALTSEGGGGGGAAPLPLLTSQHLIARVQSADTGLGQSR